MIICKSKPVNCIEITITINKQITIRGVLDLGRSTSWPLLRTICCGLKIRSNNATFGFNSILLLITYPPILWQPEEYFCHYILGQEFLVLLHSLVHHKRFHQHVYLLHDLHNLMLSPHGEY